MTSRRKARRRWLAWCRYGDHYMSEQFIATPGELRAYDGITAADNRTAARQAAEQENRNEERHARKEKT